MGKYAKRNLKHSQEILSLEDIRTLIPTIDAAFLRDRVEAYVASADFLLQDLKQIRNASHRPEDLKANFHAYGKHARLLDMVLAISVVSGYLAASDKITAQKIFQSVETKLDGYVRRQPDGIVLFEGPAGAIKTKTYSSVGRRIAGLFARVVPPTARDQSAQGALRQLLPEDVNDKIKSLLTAAKTEYAAKHYAEAEKAYKEILNIDRKNREAIRQLGALYIAANNIAGAVQYLREASLLFPNDAKVIAELAMALSESDAYEEAIEKFEQALRLKPDDVDALSGLGATYLRKGDDEKSLQFLKRAITIAPNSVHARIHMGVYYYTHGAFEEATLHYNKALKLSPQNPLLLNLYGRLLCAQHKTGLGLDYMNKALRLQPENIDFLHSKSYALLAAGRYSEGWDLFEYRLHPSQSDGKKADLIPGKPIWEGEPIPGKKLLIVAEQGLGDALHFVRYAALCKQRVGKILVYCRQPLKRLFENCPYIDEVIIHAGHLKFDTQIAMMSLPRIFKTTLENVPADIPYLFVSPGLKEEFGHRLGFSSDDRRLKIGLVWSGSMFDQTIRGDLRAKRRNMDLKQLLPLFEFENTVFCNLQMGKISEQIDELGLRARFVDCMSLVGDMLDTAAIIQNLDLVISVDTSVAHLAGALGKPVWIMSRYNGDWRWLLNRPENPWYPTARVFGQPQIGNWDAVVRDVHKALQEKISLL